MVIQYVYEDFVLSDEPVVFHQTNCVTVKPPKNSSLILELYPGANVYSEREALPNCNCAVNPATPGSVDVRVIEGRTICALNGQWAPGKPGQFANAYPGTYSDTARARLKYFKVGLETLKGVVGDRMVAAELEVGGGHRPHYLKAMEESPLKIRLYGEIHETAPHDGTKSSRTGGRGVDY